MCALLLALIATLLLVLVSSTESFELDSKLRAGLIAGAPLALTLATDLSEGLILHADFGLSANDRESAIMALDIVYRAETIIGRVSETIWVMPFIGLGMRGAIAKAQRENRFGFRIPVGLSVLDGGEPIEVFGQLAVGMTIFPDRRGTIDAGLGVRVGF